jgi:hypothetical protein
VLREDISVLEGCIIGVVEFLESLDAVLDRLG